MRDYSLAQETIHLPFDDGPHRMAMGLVARDPDDLIELDDRYVLEMAERRRLLDTQRDDVFAAIPGSDAASAEALSVLGELLPRRFPLHFSRSGDHLQNHLTGESWDLSRPSRDPLETAGRLVQEDLCLIRLQSEDPTPILAAAVLCFPSRWRLDEKIGRPLADIHGSVPLYAERLARPVDRFMSALRPGKLALRMNWSIMDDTSLFQPHGKWRRDRNESVTAENAGETLVLRVERQTLSLLPLSAHVLFGIRVHVYPLTLICRRPEIAHRLSGAVRELPESLAAYKSLPAIREPLLAYLDRRARAQEPT